MGTSAPTIYPSPTLSITIMQLVRELEPVPVITGLDERQAYRVKQAHRVSSAATTSETTSEVFVFVCRM